MRVNPTVTWVTREAVEDVEFQGLHIPRGRHRPDALPRRRHGPGRDAGPVVRHHRRAAAAPGVRLRGPPLPRPLRRPHRHGRGAAAAGAADARRATGRAGRVAAGLRQHRARCGSRSGSPRADRAAPGGAVSGRCGLPSRSWSVRAPRSGSGRRRARRGARRRRRRSACRARRWPRRWSGPGGSGRRAGPRPAPARNSSTSRPSSAAYPTRSSSSSWSCRVNSRSCMSQKRPCSRGRLDGQRGQLGVGVHLQRQVSRHVAQAVAEVGPHLVRRPGGPRAELALVVEVLDEGQLGVDRAADVVDLRVHRIAELARQRRVAAARTSSPRPGRAPSRARSPARPTAGARRPRPGPGASRPRRRGRRSAGTR